MRFTFGDCVVDPATRQLLRAGATVPLPRKTFHLLVLLLEERPRALSKEEILDRLWPDTFVTESNLSSLISDLRAATGDNARQPRYVRTVFGHGYAFCAAVAEDGDGAPPPISEFRLYCQDREIALREGVNTLGRTHEATVRIDSVTVSRRHARLVVTGGSLRLEDLGSRNGTWFGERRISEPVALSDGDEFRVGRVRVTVRVTAGTGSTGSASHP